MDIKDGEYKGLKYTIAQPRSDYPSAPKAPVYARTKAIIWVFKWFNKLSMKTETKAKVDPLRPEIKEATDQGKVVLVVLQFMEWDRKDGAGNINQMLHYAYIGAVARTRHQAYNIHKYKQTQPMIKPGPPKGWIHSKQLYLWFENEEKQKEQNKTNVGNLNWDVVK